ncbi:MAG: sulfatase [Candidatus Nealsonbacteria bacterium]|nr:sulfatase [Candidatus Nealsonbacteria bacterium]
MSRKIPSPVLLLAAIFSASVCSAAGSEEPRNEKHRAERPPNFIIFFTDDQGYNDVGCFGAAGILTPHLDRMAEEGTRFTDFYVQPVCGVSRAALMTGCYPIRVAEVGNKKAGHPVLHPKEITMAEVFETRGYATALIGKWHLAGGGKNSRGPGTGPFRSELMPRAQGFDYFFGTPAHNGFTREVNKKYITELMRNEDMLESPTDMDLLTQKYTAEAIRFITENKDRPFFLYLAHNMPHVPLGASKEFRGKSKRGLYGDVIQELDHSAGQVIDTLKNLDIDRQTLMVFTSDNGPWVESHLAGKTETDNYYGRADPLKGHKMTTYEGGPRVPCIMRWPGKIPAGRVCRELVTSMDLLPTFARLAGAKIPADRTIDGKNVLPVILGEPDVENPRKTYFYYSYNHLQAVRNGKWKLVLPRPAKPPWCSWSARMTTAVEEITLYDLRSDTVTGSNGAERNNVATEHAEVVAELMRLIEQAREDLGDYDRIGKGARFFEEGVQRPDALRWQNRS